MASYQGIAIGRVTLLDLAFLKVCHIAWKEMVKLVEESPSEPTSVPDEQDEAGC